MNSYFMKNVFEQSAFLLLLVIFVLGFSGCGKSVVQEIESVEVKDVVVNEVVKDEIVKIVNDNERKPYKFAGINIKYPEDWYYNYVEMPGGGFISNKKHEYNTEPEIGDDEVRVYIGGAPYDENIFEDKKTVKQMLKESSEWAEKNIEWTCVNHRHKNPDFCKKYESVCNSSDILEKNSKKYVLTTCNYNDKDIKDKYILKREMTYEGEYGVAHISMNMFSYKKDLINKEVLDVMFDSFIRNVLVD